MGRPSSRRESAPWRRAMTSSAPRAAMNVMSEIMYPLSDVNAKGHSVTWLRHLKVEP